MRYVVGGPTDEINAISIYHNWPELCRASSVIIPNRSS